VEGDSNAICLAVAIGGSKPENVRMLKNKMNFHVDYPVKYIVHNNTLSIWGDAILVSPLILDGDKEGVRGELIDLYVARSENLVNEDEVRIDGNKYKVIIPPTISGVNNSFPSGYAILFKDTSA
jgi:hypothetical protein